MKLIKKSLIVVILMSVVLSSLLLINPVLATSDVNYTFQDNVMYDDTSDNYLSYYTDRNYRNYSEYTQHYNATYSFEDEVVGTEGNAIDGFSSYSSDDSNAYFRIIASEDGHDNVLKHYADGDNGKASYIYYTPVIDDAIEGFFEFWCKYIDYGQGRIEFYIYDEAWQYVMYFKMECSTNNLEFSHGNGAGGNTVVTTSLPSDTWAHVKIDFNFTADVWTATVNGEELFTDEEFSLDRTGGSFQSGRLRSANGGGVNALEGYFDAFGFSVDSYNGTYTFSDDTDGSNPTDWNVIESANAVVQVRNEIDEHYKVVELYDNDVSVLSQIDKSITQTTDLVVEFYWRFNANETYGEYMRLYLYESGTSIVALWFNYQGLGYIAHEDAGVFTNIFTTGVIDTWYHIRIALNVSNYDVYVDNVLVGANLLYDDADMNAGADHIYFQTRPTVGLDYYHWLDAIDFSFDAGYYTGRNQEYYASYDNYVPYLNDTSDKYEVDRFEFAFEGFEDLYEVGEDVYSNWTEIDSGSDFCNIDSDPVSNADRRIKIENQAPSVSDAGIEKEFYIDSGILNVSWSVEYDTTSALNEFRTKIYSSDDTLIAHLYFLSNFLRGVDDTGTYELYTSITTSEVYEMNWYINQFDQISILRFYIDGVLEGVYNISLIASGKDGLGKIEMYNDASSSTSELYLDYVGVYVNGTSISEEFGHRKIRYFTLDEPTLNWDFQEHNLFQFDAIGNLSFYVAEPSYIMGVSTIVNLVPFNIYNGINTYNVYDVTFDGNSFIYIPYVWIVFYNDVALNNITISGIELTDGSNNYSLEFTSGNIETNESFFYLDTNNYLTWSLQFNDTNTEYIQANFDIIDFSDDNYSMYNYGYEHGNGYGYFGVNYADSTSKSFQIPTGLTPINNYLNYQKDITEIVILVTDDDDFSSGSNTGKVYYINFNYITSADLTLATLTLTNVILNLIVILIPSLLIYYAFDKKRDVLLISIILMLVVCFATDLIPMWLFFLGLMCMGTFFFIKTEDENF